MPSSATDQTRHGEAPAPRALQREHRERRVGAGDHQEDAGLVELAQPVSVAGEAAEIVGGGAAEHREHADGIDR